MRPWFLTAITLFCVACGDDGDDTAITCSVDERRGTYLLTSTVVSGDCGPIDTQLVVLGGDVAAGCTYDVAPTVSADQCQVETRSTCTQGDLTLRTIGVVEQIDDDASVLEGTATITIVGTCSGTYSVRYERQ